MKVLIVYAHPEPSPFCAALKCAAVEAIREGGRDAIVSDLYAEGFNPVAGRHDFLDAADTERFHCQSEQSHAARTSGIADEIAREQARAATADAIVFLFPLWWGGPPAILKGWIDRVLALWFRLCPLSSFRQWFIPVQAQPALRDDRRHAGPFHSGRRLWRDRQGSLADPTPDPRLHRTGGGRTLCMLRRTACRTGGPAPITCKPSATGSSPCSARARRRTTGGGATAR